MLFTDTTEIPSTSACPVAGTLPKEVADTVAAVQGVGEVGVTITWDPPWTQANMSEVARVALDMF